MGWDERSDYLDGQIDTQLVTSSIHLGLTLRYAIEPWLQPQVRAAAGLSVLEMRLKCMENNERTEFDDKDLSPFASVGGGLFLRTPTRLFETQNGDFASLSLGVLVEGGYTLAQAASFSLQPKDDRTNAITLKSAELGKLDRSGPYLRISLVVRF
jgi:hypothetical protein